MGLENFNRYIQYIIYVSKPSQNIIAENNEFIIRQITTKLKNLTSITTFGSLGDDYYEDLQKFINNYKKQFLKEINQFTENKNSFEYAKELYAHKYNFLQYILPNMQEIIKEHDSYAFVHNPNETRDERNKNIVLNIVDSIKAIPKLITNNFIKLVFSSSNIRDSLIQDWASQHKFKPNIFKSLTDDFKINTEKCLTNKSVSVQNCKAIINDFHKYLTIMRSDIIIVNSSKNTSKNQLGQDSNLYDIVKEIILSKYNLVYQNTDINIEHNTPEIIARKIIYFIHIFKKVNTAKQNFGMFSKFLNQTDGGYKKFKKKSRLHTKLRVKSKKKPFLRRNKYRSRNKNRTRQNVKKR